MATPALSPPQPAARSQNCFDFLRLFAATCVVVQHSTFHLNLPLFWLEPDGRWWFYDGVPLFFILSGMLVYRSAETCMTAGRPLRDYFQNRVLRIAPAIYAYVVITIVLLLALGAIHWQALFSGEFAAWLGASLALAPVYNPPMFRHIGLGAINGSLWTIPVEVSFYVLVPVFVWLARRFTFVKMISAVWLTGLIAMTAFWWLEVQTGRSLTYKLMAVTLFPHLGYFALGMTWARLWRRAPKSWWLAAAGAAVYVLIRIVYLGPKTHTHALWTIAWALPLSYAAIWLAYHGPAVFSSLTAKIGDLSFGIYIWHGVVINVMLYLGVRQSALGQHWTAHLVLFTATFVMAWLSWWLIEKRALQMKRFTSRGATGNGRDDRP
jgi:peptidoglycan/LPS O-acetylase OafA/YrhL